MTEPIKVEAEVVETDISPLARSEQWLAQARERVAGLAAQYRPPEEITDDAGYKDAKAARASARRDAKELDDERKRMTREMDDALKRFRADVKGVLEPLTAIDVAYKEALDAYEERWGQQRMQDLLDAYEEYAPDLMELVPLDRLIALRGSERGKAWLNRSTNLVAAQAALRAAIDQVAADEQTLAASVADEDLEAAKADLFTTLDLGSAIRSAQARAEQRERVRRLEEERRRREEEQRRIEAEMAERRARQERERQEREEAARREREAAAAAPAPVPGPVPYEPPAIIEPPQAMPVPSPLLEHVAETMGQPEPGKVPPYLMCAYGSSQDAAAFRTFCTNRNIRATVKPTGGSTYRIVRR